MADSDLTPAIDAGFEKLGLPTAQKHAFLCAGPKCVDEAEGLKSWERLKARVKETGIPVMRCRAACLRVCVGGPWMVVYPEGVWYGAVTPEKCDRIVDEHLVQHRPIEEWIVRRHPLGSDEALT